MLKGSIFSTFVASCFGLFFSHYVLAADSFPSHYGAIDNTKPDSSIVNMSARVYRQFLEVPAATQHTATVIFIHGLGDTGHGWIDAVQNWRARDRLNHVKFILPHAPIIPITCNGGMEMPGWYDIAALTGRVEDLRGSQDESGTLESRQYLQGLIQAEIDKSKIKSERIVIGGFSQGGAMALFTALTGPKKLAGVVGLSSYLPLDERVPEFLKTHDFNKDTPIFMGHGDRDMVVPTAFGKSSSELLEKMGYKVSFKLYRGMQHSACLEEMEDVKNFLVERLPAKFDEGKEESKSEL